MWQESQQSLEGAFAFALELAEGCLLLLWQEIQWQESQWSREGDFAFALLELLERLPKDLKERLPTDKRVWREPFALALLFAFALYFYCKLVMLQNQIATLCMHAESEVLGGSLLR